MPRPGPRPYECVRRAWHSDRHQPMRASLIQHLFRMANQVHDAATRENHEWQDKLPSVILKAEEILYSKANSEAEYMDLDTLWERANEAVDTIIRKDENSETGDLLFPCIEAALILGCIPRRASRSQRYNNPSCYLNPNDSTPNHNLTPVLVKPTPPNPNPNPNPNSVINNESPNSSYYQANVNKTDLLIEGCDLSLRLGPNWLLESSCSEDMEDAGSTSCYA